MYAFFFPAKNCDHGRFRTIFDNFRTCFAFGSCRLLGRLISNSGDVDAFEEFTADFSASTAVVCRNPWPMGLEMLEMLYTTGAVEGGPSIHGDFSLHQGWCMKCFVQTTFSFTNYLLGHQVRRL